MLHPFIWQQPHCSNIQCGCCFLECLFFLVFVILIDNEDDYANNQRVWKY